MEPISLQSPEFQHRGGTEVTCTMLNTRRPVHGYSFTLCEILWPGVVVSGQAPRPHSAVAQEGGALGFVYNRPFEDQPVGGGGMLAVHCICPAALELRTSLPLAAPPFQQADRHRRPSRLALHDPVLQIEANVAIPCRVRDKSGRVMRPAGG